MNIIIVVKVDNIHTRIYIGIFKELKTAVRWLKKLRVSVCHIAEDR